MSKLTKKKETSINPKSFLGEVEFNVREAIRVGNSAAIDSNIKIIKEYLKTIKGKKVKEGHNSDLIGINDLLNDLVTKKNNIAAKEGVGNNSNKYMPTLKY